MDSITDLLNIIKNAEATGRSHVLMPASKLRQAFLELLKKEGFIDSFEKKGRGKIKAMEVALRYNDKIPALSGFKRISKPGQRIYAERKKIIGIKKGYGVVIVSTSKGLMTDKEAMRNRIGGEVMAEVW